jgi:hypothetical protein
MTKIDDDDVTASARELVARRGLAARQEAEERVAEFERQARWPEHAIAVRILTMVENLLGERLP